MSTVTPRALRLEQLTLDHVPTLLEAEQEAYPDPWSERMFRQETESAISNFWVAYVEDILVGYGGFWYVVDEAHITKVTVLPAHRGRGYGRALLERLLDEARRVGARTARLEVREHNQVARRLYDSLGFEAVRLRRGYYAKTGEPAVVMTQQLRNA